MRELATIGLVAALALSASLALAQGGSAIGAIGSSGTETVGVSGAGGMTGLGISSRMTHPPGSTTGYRVVGGRTTTRGPFDKSEQQPRDGARDVEPARR